MASGRTGHGTPTHSPEPPPVYGRGADGPEYPDTGGKAASEDRQQRAAWGARLGSAYLSRVALPDRVGPGDCPHAQVILDRVEECLARPAHYTRLERRRLRAMREAWGRRASGRDVGFNLLGWVKRERYAGRGRWEDKQEAARFETAMEAVQDGW